MEDIRYKLGCLAAALIVVVGPFGCLYCRMGGEYQLEPPAEEGTVEQVKQLRKKGDPEAALAACREQLAADPDAETEQKLRRLEVECLEDLYSAHLKADPPRYDEAEAVVREMREEHADSPTTEKTYRFWLGHLCSWCNRALAADDLALAARIADQIVAHPDWRATRADDPVLELLARRWRIALERDGVEAAERLFEPFLAREKTAGLHRVKQEHRAFLAAALLVAWQAGEPEAADARWRQVHAKARGAGRLEIGPLAGFLAERVAALAAAGDAAAADALFDDVESVARSADKDALCAIQTAQVDALWRRAAQAGDWKAAEAALAKRKWMTHASVDAWRSEYLLMRWKAQRAAGETEPARAALRGLVERAAPEQHEAVTAAMREEWTLEELLAMGDAYLAKKRHAPAARCFELVAAGSPDDEALADRLIECKLQAADAAAGAGVDWARFGQAERLYEELLFDTPRFAADRARWRRTLASLLRLQLHWADLYGDDANGRFEDAERKVERAARVTAVAMWRDALGEDGEVWAGVPAPIRERVEKDASLADRAARIDALAELAATGRWLVPQAKPTEALLARVRENSAFAQAQDALGRIDWPGKLPQVLEALRKVVRKYPGSKAHARAKEGLQGAISKTHGTVHLYVEVGNPAAAEQFREQLTRLCDLLAFYVAELGPLAPDDPYRGTLRRNLTDVAELAGKGGAKQLRVFMLSLLADAMPDDEAAKKARAEALAGGLELMEQFPAKPPEQGPSFPSLVAGASALAAENQTPFHMLIYFRGPEQTYARLNPYSRGTIVVKDGTYEIAVAVISETTRPYRTRQAFERIVRGASFVITSAADEKPLYDPQEITTDFRILRAPPEAGPLIAHPGSGIVFPGK